MQIKKLQEIGLLRLTAVMRLNLHKKKKKQLQTKHITKNSLISVPLREAISHHQILCQGMSLTDRFLAHFCCSLRCYCVHLSTPFPCLRVLASTVVLTGCCMYLCVSCATWQLIPLSSSTDHSVFRLR